MIFLAAAAGAAEAPFELVAEKVVFPAKVNGVGPYPFLLDLTAPGAVVDTDVAAYVKLSGGEGTVEAGGGTGRNVPIAAADLKGFGRRLGTGIAGVANGREFGPHLLLDFAAGMVDFGKPETALAAKGPGVVKMPMGESGPVVSGLVNGKHVLPFVLDSTLSASVSIPEPVLKELGLLTDSTPRIELDAPPTGETHTGAVQVRLGSVRVSGAEVREPVCAVAEEGAPARLGIGFLRRFRARFDYEKQLALFEPPDAGKVYREPALTGYGVGLWKLSGAYWMIWVARESPAAEAGLVSGGILTAVDGKDVKEMGSGALAALLEPHLGAKITLSVLQGDDTHRVELAPRKLL